MKLYYELLKLVFNKYIKRYKNGRLVKDFSENMGVVYIKLAQILATQNFKELFTEEDRLLLSGICDNCNPVSFDEIKSIIEEEYRCSTEDLFLSIDPIPIGSASVAQVHKAKLKNGDIVAIKVKRKDITSNIEKEIQRIKKLMFRFGKFVKLGNLSGSDKALSLYLSWIFQETDFLHEAKNIKTYLEFANSVNDKIEGNKLIKVPKLYEEFSTNNIIVMEYINHKTINHLELNEENSEKIRIALNSYISSSLYALFNDLKIVFHGDPHGGNIYIDDFGNIGFLDMGLLFELSESDAKLTRDFFFAAYTRNYEKMYNLVIPYGKMTDHKKRQFKEDVKDYCDKLSSKPVTSYFIDMMNICLKYEVCPPNFLFYIAKSFMCLNGINNFSKNQTSGIELLKEQVLEFYIKRSLQETQDIVISSIKVTPNFVKNSCKYGLVKAVVKSVSENEVLYEQTKGALEHYREMLDMLKPLDQSNKKRTRNKNETI